MDTVDGLKPIEKFIDFSKVFTKYISNIQWKLVPIKVVYFFFALGN